MRDLTAPNPMFDQLLSLFRNNIQKARDSSDAAVAEQGYRVSAAALLVETIRADHQVSDAERKTLLNLLERSFQLSAADAEALLQQAEHAATDATSLYQFTTILNAELDNAQKEHLIELMWQAAFADGQLDRHEEHLVRRVADLIYVPHSRFIRAKLRVMGAPRD